ncbi:hypothetical protein NQ312_27845, partial [Escherichia coli]|nr:hypothetical protein [Escherichia coli]
ILKLRLHLIFISLELFTKRVKMHKFLVDMGNNTILQKDMEDLAAVSPILRELSNVTVLVTGATGLIGRHCISALMALNDL